DGERLRGDIGAGSPIALRGLVNPKVRRAIEVEHEIEALAARAIAAIEIDRADRAARRDTSAVVATAVEIDLEAPVDRLLGAGLDARRTARAHLEVDRILLRPFGLERAEPTGEPPELPRVDGIGSFQRQLAAGGASGDENGHAELRLQRIGPLQRRVRGSHDQ